MDEYFAALPDPPPIKTRSTTARDALGLPPSVRRIDTALADPNKYHELIKAFR